MADNALTNARSLESLFALADATRRRAEAAMASSRWLVDQSVNLCEWAQLPNARTSRPRDIRNVTETDLEAILLTTLRMLSALPADVRDSPQFREQSVLLEDQIRSLQPTREAGATCLRVLDPA